MKFLIFSFFIIIVVIGNSVAQDVEFFREDIKFEISDDYFIVEGDYYFCNVGERSINQILFYPFPQGKNYGEVDTISVVEVNTKINVLRKFNEKGATFVIKIKSYDIEKYKIYYKQKLLGNKAEYILNTTKSWKKPLEKANYELLTDVNCTIDSISYLPDSTLKTGRYNYYYWRKKDFMPDKNFEIYYK